MKRLAYIGRIGAIITADSEPQLDEWGWGNYWSCSQWITWHTMNVKKYGVEIANNKMIQYWDKQTFGAKPKMSCPIDKSFIDYFNQYGLTYNPVYNALRRAYNTTEELFAIVKDKTGQGLKNAYDTAFFFTAAAGLFVVYLGYQLLKPDNIKNTVRTTAKAAKYL